MYGLWRMTHVTFMIVLLVNLFIVMWSVRFGIISNTSLISLFILIFLLLSVLTRLMLDMLSYNIITYGRLRKKK